MKVTAMPVEMNTVMKVLNWQKNVFPPVTTTKKTHQITK